LPPLGGAWFYNRFERFTNNPPALPEVTEFWVTKGGEKIQIVLQKACTNDQMIIR
jgi:hypothetical protein